MGHVTIGHHATSSQQDSTPQRETIRPRWERLGGLNPHHFENIDDAILDYMRPVGYVRGMVPSLSMRDSLTPALGRMFLLADELLGADRLPDGTAFITTDHKVIMKGDTHRRPGWHFDGKWYGDWVEKNPSSGFKAARADATRVRHNITGDDGGVLLCSNKAGCEIVLNDVKGTALEGGDCEHLSDQFSETMVLEPYIVYWLSPTTIHRSVPMTCDTDRTLIRISLPTKEPYHPDMRY